MDGPRRAAPAEGRAQKSEAVGQHHQRILANNWKPSVIVKVDAISDEFSRLRAAEAGG